MINVQTEKAQKHFLENEKRTTRIGESTKANNRILSQAFKVDQSRLDS